MSLVTIPANFGSGGSGLSPTSDPVVNLKNILTQLTSAVTTLQGGGGGGGTVHTSAPITGDGSVGSPITTALAGLSAGTRVTAGSDQANLTASSLNSLTAGGYELVFDWVAGTGGDTNLLLQLNGVTTGYSSQGSYATNGVASDNASTGGLGTAVADTTGFDVARAGGSAGRNRVTGHITLRPSANGFTMVYVESMSYASADATVLESFNLFGMFPSSTITQFAFVTLNGSSTGIKQNSFVVYRPLGLTA